MFLGPAMFDKIPGEVYLTSVTPPLLGLSEVTMDISVSHTFLHSPWSTAICKLFSALFSSAFLSSQAWIYLLPFPAPYIAGIAHADTKAPVRTSLQFDLLY